MEKEWGTGRFVPFDADAFFACWFSSRRLRLRPRYGYNKNISWLNQTGDGKCFGKVPQDVYEMWHSAFRGYLPIDRDLYLGSLIAARDREYGVCRLKQKMLANARAAREAPPYFAVDEQNVPYWGRLSGAKKRLPKKTMEGLEYFAVATSNKGYMGWKDEVRGLPTEDHPLGEVITPADPVVGGYKLNYIMEGGRKYEVGGTTSSKSFSTMALLIFMCGNYLRYGQSVAVTDSAFGFLDSMFFLTLWSLHWVSSVRMGQKRGYLGVSELVKAGSRKISKDKSTSRKDKSERKKSNIQKNVSSWEKENKSVSKGTFWVWKTVVEIVQGTFSTVYLTAVRDSKFV